MTALLMLLLLWAPPPPSSLDQVKAEPNPEHRAHAAIEYAAVAEKNAEMAFAKGDTDTLSGALKEISESFDIAEESFVASRKTPGRNPGPYKYAEVHSRELLIRLGDLEQRLDPSEQSLVEGVKAKVQKIHDVWFEGIMERAR
jgi:hypothetical protein